jgi:hypothetical protein
MAVKKANKVAQLTRRLKAAEKRRDAIGARWSKLDEQREMLHSKVSRAASLMFTSTGAKVTPGRKKKLSSGAMKANQKITRIGKLLAKLDAQHSVADEKVEWLKHNLRLAKAGKRLGDEEETPWYANPMKRRTAKKKNPRYLVTARKRQVRDVDLGILQDKTGKAAVARAKSLYAGQGYTAIKAKRKNPLPPVPRSKALEDFREELSELTGKKKRPSVRQINRLIELGLEARVPPIRLKRILMQYVGRKHATELVNAKVTARNPKRRKNRTIIKARRVTVLSANPCGGRARNKAARLTEADIAKLPPHVQQQLRAQQQKVEEKEAKATTPAQKKAAVKARRSFLARLGTRLRVIGQTKKIKVSARDLGRCPRKTIKVRARHEADALAKARAKLGDRFDQLKVANGRKRRSTKANPLRASAGVRALREKFTGQAARKTAVMSAPKGTPANLAKLGKLILIKAQKATIKPSAKNPAGVVWLCADAKGKLHLCTTGERLVDGPARSFGEVTQIEYEACKPHLGHPRPTIFFHKLGEEGGRRPELVADGQGGLKFKGGDYTIAREGIRD